MTQQQTKALPSPVPTAHEQQTKNKEESRSSTDCTLQAVTTTPPYRILMIAPTSFFADYGCHVRILEETRILQALGHQVTIATYHNGKGVPGIDIRRTLPIPWRRHYEVGSSRHKIAFDLLLGLKTMELILWGWLRGRRYDVIHAHLHEGALIGHVLGKLFGIPVVFDFQGSLTEEMIDHNFLHRGSPLYRPLRRLEEWIDRTSRVIFTSSSEARRILLQQFGCTEAQVRALPDCVETNTFVPAAMQETTTLARLRSDLALPEGAKVVVYLGLLAPYQGTDLLLQAMQRIVSTRSDVYLLLMGFPGIDIYRNQAATLGISDHVRLTGRIPYQEAPLYLALGDVAVAPKLSVTESAGKLLNYMGVGIPTVAFDTPVAREYLGNAGLLAERGNATDLANQLLQALALPEKGQELRQRAIEQFSWHNAGQQIVAAYAELTNQSEPDAAQRSAATNPQRQSRTQRWLDRIVTKLVAHKTLWAKRLRSKGMVIQE